MSEKRKPNSLSFYCRFFSLTLFVLTLFLVSLLAVSASATITLNWTAPTTNTDGTTLTDLQGYNVYYGSGSPCSFATTLNLGNVLTYQFNLASGTYCFAVTAYDTSGYESAYSNIVYKTETASDTTAPTVTAFAIPATSTSLTVSITTFTATDNVGVTGYTVNESATAPLATATGWSAAAPVSYTFATAGAKTLYAWAKDAAGNVSTSKNASAVITLPDTTPPTVTAFTVPATATSLTVSITSLTATDNVAVTGYMVNESATAPLATATGWSAAAPASYIFATAGAKTLYAWAKDAAGNVSTSKNASAVITLPDNTAPIVTAFTIPVTSTSLTVIISVFTATDNVSVTGYMVSESATAPLATAIGWSAAAPVSYTFATTGTKTLYAWVKDAAGNVSTSKNASVIVGTVSTTTISILPVNDTFINLDSNNNSASETLNTYTWPNDKIANSVLMKFDLSSIPAGAIIQSATLNLYLIDADTNAAYPTYNLSLNRIINHNPDFSSSTGYTYDGTNSWTPNSVCYNNIPLAQADISPVYDTEAIDKTVSFKGWNATQLITDWLANPSLNYGLMINSDATKVADTYRTFASSKHPTASYRPYLTITYAGNPPVCTNPNFKIGGSTYSYQSIQTACDGLSTGEILELQAITFSGDLTLQQNISITIQGGYNCDFSSNSGYTVIHSTLTIKDGSLTAANLIIQ